MSQESSQSSAVERFWSVVQRSSGYILLGAIFSIPGLLAVYLVTPRAVGFFLIGATGMIAHVVMQSLDPDRTPESEVDLSEYTKIEAIIFILALLLSAVIAVSVKLLAATGLGYLAALGSSSPVIGISLALVFPIIDRKLATMRWYLSISAIAGIAIIYAIIFALKMVDEVDHISQDTLTESSRRFSI